jgi:hypothetical protein
LRLAALSHFHEDFFEVLFVAEFLDRLLVFNVFSKLEN